MRKLSAVQKEVLEHMARGHKLYVGTSGGGAPWLHGVLDQHGQHKSIYSNTLYALRDRGYIEKTYVPTTPWWRSDYIITEKGREALDETHNGS